MIKLVMPKVSAIILLVLGSTFFCAAQDTGKTAHKVIKPPVVAKQVPTKPYITKPYVAKPYAGSYKPAAATTPAVPVTQPAIVAPTPISTDKSLEGQYQYILTKIYHYQQPMVAAFWKNVKDTLNTQRTGLKKAQATLTEQYKKLSDLQADVTTKDQTLSASNARVDSISVFGFPMSKTAYNLMMWGLVIGFGLALIIVIFTTARNRSETRYRTKLFDELTEEFQAYKAKANDKEKKLARELQTERNKVDELMGRG